MTKSRFKIWVFLLHCIFFLGELIIHYDFLKSDPKLVHSVKLKFFYFSWNLFEYINLYACIKYECIQVISELFIAIFMHIFCLEYFI